MPLQREVLRLLPDFRLGAGLADFRARALRKPGQELGREGIDCRGRLPDRRGIGRRSLQRIADLLRFVAERLHVVLALLHQSEGLVLAHRCGGGGVLCLGRGNDGVRLVGGLLRLATGKQQDCAQGAG